MKPNDIARICHAANRELCVTQGDFSQPEWAEAPEWQRKSAINGVEHAQAHPDATPESMHDNWSAEKLADGWVYGPTKNPETKEHPCLVAYDQLPEAQRAKDHLFLGIVRALS